MPSSRPFISLLFGSFSTSYQQRTQQPATAPTSQATAEATKLTATATTSTSQGVYKILDNHNTMHVPSEPAPMEPSSLSESPHDKLWIGGRSTDGREKFYRLEPSKRRASFDRISLDQLSI